MRIRNLASLLAAIALSGCVTPYPDLTQSRSPCRMEPGGWCDFVREAAVETYAYAMLSSNAYKDENFYVRLPAPFVERKAAGNDDSGLAYSVFDKYAALGEEGGEHGALAARVIAFRGTDPGSTSDLISGTLGDGQREGARMVYLAERAQLDAEQLQDVPIIVTGHSLGGALATQVSIENPGVKAYVFNTSPFFSGDPRVGDADRIAVAERGEFLRVLRRYKAPSASDVTVINCNPSASAGEKHSIHKLADCLTWIAAYEDQAALAAITPNGIGKPEIECGAADKVHGGAVVAAVPCLHAPKKNRRD